MAISCWLCTNTTKNMVVKIVHPGGHTELHDRPVLAAEIMLRNPRCLVAYPNVFQQPWAVVAPETPLMLGQKYYVVPLSTVRKLQRLSPHREYPPSPSLQDSEIRKARAQEKEEDLVSTYCWFFMPKSSTPKAPYSCLENSDDNSDKVNGVRGRSGGLICHDNCFLEGMKVIKARESDPAEESTSSSSSSGSSETKGLTRKRTKDTRRGSPKRFASIDHWQPGLESITEE